MSGALDTFASAADAAGLHRAIQAALERMERAPAEEVAATVLAALERIVRHARDTTHFYADRLAPLFTGDEFLPQGWSGIPILTRAAATEHADAIRSARLPEGTLAQENVTSGSSGTPLRFAWSTVASVSTRAVVERMAMWHGLDPSAPLAEIRSFPDSAFPGRRANRSWNQRDPAAPYYRLGVTATTRQQLGWLQLVEPRYLLTYPTMARELAKDARSDGLTLSFDAVLTVGEVLTDEIRELVRAAFGAKVIDSYGCQEMGKIAIECEVSGHYHVCASNVLLEVLDEDGRQVAPGEIGRIVVTSLYNYAMPFIRYEIGDYGRLGGRCACGRSLPVLTEVLGRRRNMVTLPDGERLWIPGRTLAELGACVPMQRMRLVQTSPEGFELLYVPRDGAGAPDAAGLQAAAARLLHPRVNLSPVAVDDLPRSPGGKYEDVVGLAA